MIGAIPVVADICYTYAMNFFERYQKYLENNPQGYWFKRKLYGWGWIPARWQGWVTLLVFLLGLVGLAVSFGRILEPTSGQTTRFLLEVFGWVLLWIGVCYLKGESPRWQWGVKDEEK